MGMSTLPLPTEHMPHPAARRRHCSPSCRHERRPGPAGHRTAEATLRACASAQALHAACRIEPVKSPPAGCLLPCKQRPRCSGIECAAPGRNAVTVTGTEDCSRPAARSVSARRAARPRVAWGRPGPCVSDPPQQSTCTRAAMKVGRLRRTGAPCRVEEVVDLGLCGWLRRRLGHVADLLPELGQHLRIIPVLHHRAHAVLLDVLKHPLHACTGGLVHHLCGSHASWARGRRCGAVQHYNDGDGARNRLHSQGWAGPVLRVCLN